MWLDSKSTVNTINYSVERKEKLTFSIAQIYFFYRTFSIFFCSALFSVFDSVIANDS